MISSKFLASAMISVVAISNLQVSAKEDVAGFLEMRFGCNPCHHVAAARQRIDAQLLDLSDPALIAALAIASSRGVQVDVTSTRGAADDKRSLLHHLIRSGVTVTITDRPIAYELWIDGEARQSGSTPIISPMNIQ